MVRLFAAVVCLAFPVQAFSESFEIGFAGEEGSASFRGAELGVAEANRQGRYFQKELALRAAAPEAEGAPEVWIFAGEDISTRDALLASGGTVIDVRSRDVADRTRCTPQLFFTAPSDAMVERATEIYAERSDAPAPDDLSLRAWHPSLVKYAARDLNRRYLEKYETPMDPEAWAGWAATRILGEAWLRGPDKDANSVGAFLRDSLSFDGQKGVALSFDPSGQLRQVLFAVAADKVVGEVPRGKNTASEVETLAAHSCAADS